MTTTDPPPTDPPPPPRRDRLVRTGMFGVDKIIARLSGRTKAPELPPRRERLVRSGFFRIQDLDNPTAPRKPGRIAWIAKWVGRFLSFNSLLLLVAFLLLVAWVHSDDFQQRTTTIAETLLEDQLGEAVTLGRVNVRFWPPGVGFEGLHIFDPLGGGTILSAERVHAPLVLRGGGLKIGRLKIQSPMIRLHLEKEGGKLVLQEFRNLKRPKNPKPLTELPWSSLELSDGSIQLSTPQGRVALEHLQVVPISGAVADIEADLEIGAQRLTESTHLSLLGTQLGPERIIVPNLDLSLRSLRLGGTADIPLQGVLDIDLIASVDLDDFNDLLTEPRQAHGLVDLDLHIGGTAKDLHTEISAMAKGFALELPGRRTPLLTYEFGDVTASVFANKQEIHIERVLLDWGQRGQARAWGIIDVPSKSLRESHIVGDHISLSEVLMRFPAAPHPWIDMNADLEVSLSGPLNPPYLQGDFELSVADLQVADRPIRDPSHELYLDLPNAYTEGSMIVEKTRVYLYAPVVKGPRSHGELTCDIGTGPRGPLDLNFNLVHTDLRDFQPLNGTELRGKGVVSGRIWGPFNQLQFLGKGDLRDFSVVGTQWADHLVVDRLVSPHLKTLEFRDAQATVGSSHYQGDYNIDFHSPATMDTNLTLTSGRIEDLTGMFLDLPGMTGDMTGYLQLHGPFNDLDGETHFAFRDVDLWGEHFPTGAVSGYMDHGLFTLDDLRVTRNRGREGLQIRGSVKRDWALDMEVVGDGFELQTLDWLAPSKLPVTGKAALVAHVGNTLFEPEPTGRLDISEVRYDGFTVDDSQIVFGTDDGVMSYAGVLAAGAITLDGTLGLWDAQPYALDAQLDHFPAHLFYPTAADGEPVRAEVSGDVAISGHFGEVWSPVDLRAALQPGQVQVSWREHTLTNPATWHVAQRGNSWEIAGISLSGGRTDFKLTEGSSGPQGLDVRGGGVADMDLLRMVVPGLEKSEGLVRVDFSAIGSAPNVSTVANIQLEGDLIRHVTVPEAFEDLRASVVATADHIEIVDLTAQLGGGTVTLTRGDIEAENWIPTRYALAGEVRDAQVKWTESLPHAIGDADLVFDGPADKLLLSGDIQIEQMDFFDRVDWEDWVVDYNEAFMVDAAPTYVDPYFSMNIGITSLPGAIQLRNNVATATATAKLQIVGDTSRPGILGDIEILDGARAYIQDREFQVLRGHMTYTDPWSWDPQIDFDLMTDIESRSQTYRVHYLASGPFSNWQVDPRSEPALSRADINALLYFGATTQELEETGQLTSAVLMAAGDLMVTDLMITRGAGEILPVDALQFDRVDLVTGVNSRGEYSSDPRLLVSKHVDDLFDVDVDMDITFEINMVRGAQDAYLRADKKLNDTFTLSLWYATLQRDRVLPWGGAIGVDGTARWEWERR